VGTVLDDAVCHVENIRVSQSAEWSVRRGLLTHRSNGFFSVVGRSCRRLNRRFAATCTSVVSAPRSRPQAAQRTSRKWTTPPLSLFARIAKAHDAKSFTLVSAMGANAGSMFFYNQVKGRTEDDVKALGLRSVIIFRPALLVGPRNESRLAESIAIKTLVPLSRLLPSRFRKRVVTYAETLAMRMLTEGKASPSGVRVIPAQDI